MTSISQSKLVRWLSSLIMITLGLMALYAVALFTLNTDGMLAFPISGLVLFLFGLVSCIGAVKQFRTHSARWVVMAALLGVGYFGAHIIDTYMFLLPQITIEPVAEFAQDRVWGTALWGSSIIFALFALPLWRNLMPEHSPS